MISIPETEFSAQPTASSLKLWLFVVFAFLLLIGAWTTLIFIAAKHTPRTVPLENSVHEKVHTQGKRAVKNS